MTQLQSTSLLRGKTFASICLCSSINASIHFPLAREDKELQQWRWKKDASIHFPLAREDDNKQSCFYNISVLQSTSLLRGKTRYGIYRTYVGRLQSTSLLRGKTLQEISDLKDMVLQSTSLLRGKTIRNLTDCMYLCASIHFPLAREDRRAILPCSRVSCFNPLPSCEGRHISK
mgnify:CR=1 FL=1